MGFFSWKTIDTHESISNSSSNRSTFPVTVLCPDGNHIEESDYEGYGIFGGYDIYQLVAQWNCPEKCNGDVDHDRNIGIDISCYDAAHGKLEFPIRIVEGFNDGDIRYDAYVGFSESCPDQGYFYGEDEE